jgi:hypothetical protein
MAYSEHLPHLDSIAHDKYIKSSSAHSLEAPIYLSLEENFGKVVKAGQHALITCDAFLFDDWVTIVHMIAVEANRVMFQLRGPEYVEQTFCDGGELAVLHEMITEHGATGCHKKLRVHPLISMAHQHFSNPY